MLPFDAAGVRPLSYIVQGFAVTPFASESNSHRA
jgi:hypothetical protein